jgi:bla regulator protein blaR1
MEFYLLKSTLCLAIFYAFYKLILEKESMHMVKRFYLLGGMLLSFLIPVITFTRYIEVQPNIAAITNGGGITMISSEVKSNPDYLSFFLWGIYLMGVVYFAFKFCEKLFAITHKITHNERIKRKNLFHVLLQTPTTPHTFFNYIFLNKDKYEAQQIPKEVLLHEQIHAKQKHSIDTIFIELTQIIFWFNPLIYFLKRSIKLNHEFLADQGVLQQGTDKIMYQNILLAFSSGAATPIMANSINYSSIKKRFTVMKTSTSTKKKWLLGLLIIPLLSLVLFSFSNREVAFKLTAQSTGTTTTQQEIASPKEIAEYNRLAKRYNAQPKDSRVVILKDLQRMEFIYKKMSVTQKEGSEPFPECPPPPPSPSAPTSAPTIASLEPVDHIIRMAKENAVFFYEEQPISSDKAIALLKKNKDLNIETVTFKNSNPIVKISTKPYTPKTKDVSGPVTDPAANIIDIAKRGGTFYIDGEKVSADKAIQTLRENERLKVDIDETDPDNPKVWIKSC